MRFPWSSTSRRVRHKPLLQVPFVGQAAVLAALASHVQTAQHGTVQCVTLTGQAGSGKSALLEEFLFLHCTTPGVLLLQLNAAACLREYEFYRQLCTALQARGEHILQTVYNATKRVRKTLALQWDEAEFRQVLASTDWAQLYEVPPSVRSMPGRVANSLAPLLASIQEHPWAIGAAAILGVLGRGVAGSTAQRVWAQRWVMFLRALHARYRPGEAVIVLAIERMNCMSCSTTTMAWRSLSSRMRAAIRRRSSAVMPAVGSSSRMSCGEEAMARASSNRRWSP